MTENATINATNVTPAGSEPEDLTNRRIQHEAAQAPAKSGPWFTDTVGPSRENAWFAEREREAIERLKRRPTK